MLHEVLSFNSLFEMPAVNSTYWSPYLRSNLSILYLRCARYARRFGVDEQTSFNSLFEMPVSLGAPYESQVACKLSILYLRCPTTASTPLRMYGLDLSILYLRCLNTLAHHGLLYGGFKLSILYLRCSRAAFTGPAPSPATFNSLFEMLECGAVVADSAYADLLSILYLRCSSQLATAVAKTAQTTLSILYLRCHSRVVVDYGFA